MDQSEEFDPRITKNGFLNFMLHVRLVSSYISSPKQRLQIGTQIWNDFPEAIKQEYRDKAIVQRHIREANAYMSWVRERQRVPAIPSSDEVGATGQSANSAEDLVARDPADSGISQGTPSEDPTESAESAI